MPCKGRSTARGMEEEFNGRAEKESKGALWQKSATRSKVIRVRIDNRRSNSIVLDLQVQEKGVSYRRQPGKEVVPLWKWRKLSWYGCKEKTEEKVAWPRETKVQQSGVRVGDPESTAKEGGSVRGTLGEAPSHTAM